MNPTPTTCWPKLPCEPPKVFRRARQLPAQLGIPGACAHGELSLVPLFESDPLAATKKQVLLPATGELAGHCPPAGAEAAKSGLAINISVKNIAVRSSLAMMIGPPVQITSTAHFTLPLPSPPLAQGSDLVQGRTSLQLASSPGLRLVWPPGIPRGASFLSWPRRCGGHRRPQPGPGAVR